MIPKNYIYTYSGASFSPLSPNESDINPVDIAHALSLMCRANGHFRSFYSVAQHCLDCEKEAFARGFSREERLGCLLHDASEAYISDITRPVKLGLPQYLVIEKCLQDTIYRRFGLNPDDESLLEKIKLIDNSMLYHEFLALGGLALYEEAPKIFSNPSFGFELFDQVEKNYLNKLNELM